MSPYAEEQHYKNGMRKEPDGFMDIECFLFCPFPSNNLVTSTLRKYKFGQKDIDQ